jgi:serine protease AprX
VNQKRSTRRLSRTGLYIAAGLVAALTVVSAAPAGQEPSPSTAATGSAAAPSDRPAVVDRVLVQQLARSKTGRVQAIITMWNRAGLADVQRLGIRGTRLNLLPMVLVNDLTAQQLEQLRRLPGVRSVWANRKHTLEMEDTTWITKARYVWEGRLFLNPTPANASLAVKGDGVEIAVIDTGIDGKHEDADNLYEFCETTLAVSGLASEVRCSPTPTPPPTTPISPSPGAPTTPCSSPLPGSNNPRIDSTDGEGGGGHGTHVSGTIAGSGDASGGMAGTHSTIGMAPGAKLRVYSANVGPALANFQILSAYDDMTCKKLKGLNNVVATSNSFGGGDGANYSPDDPSEIAVKRAYDAGILSVYAAGNSGPEHNTLSSNCVSPWVVCVAASTKLDGVVGFSSRGRPSELADTNRNGRIGQPGGVAATDENPTGNTDQGDIAPDNHDRRLGQVLGIGLYRPSVTAPGVNVNSMDAQFDDSPTTCLEDDLVGEDGNRGPNASTSPANCYVPFNGTSMATPHVSGLVALIVEAYRKTHGGATPNSGVITEILERSSNVTKLPGYESEEQGAGRIDAIRAVRFAREYPSGLPPANLGTPSPPYVAGNSPFQTAQQGPSQTGCTLPGSYSTGITNPVDSPGADQPPIVAATGFGQHFITVPPKTERMRITVSWPEHPGANLYARLFRPGHNPANETMPPGPNRVFPEQEAVGLADTGAILGQQRFLDIRAPEETNDSEGAGPPPALPSGRWVLRIYHRVGGAPLPCTGAHESPDYAVAPAYNYNLKIELPLAEQAPTVAITGPAANSTISQRFTQLNGTAAYPTPWEGVTYWNVPGTGGGGASGPTTEPMPDNRPVLYLHGNPHNVGEPSELGPPPCTGDGRADLLACGGPFLIPSSTLFTGAAASWKPPISPLVDGTADRNIYDPNWVWCLATGPDCPALPTGAPARRGPTTVRGPMTVEWWATTNAGAGVFTMGWTIRLWADGRLAFESGRVEETPLAPGVPSRLEAVVNLPQIRAEQRFVLHIDVNPIDVDQNLTQIYYDSTLPCVAGVTTGPCDSLVRMPVGNTGGGTFEPETTGPQNVRVTDVNGKAPPGSTTLQNGLRVAWDAVQGATSYQVFRGTSPNFTLGTPIATVPSSATCTSPNVPSWPTASRAGVCYNDTSATAVGTTYYYRVKAVTSAGASQASLLAYGIPTAFDRQVKLKVDRIYGPLQWEYATVFSDGALWYYFWDTLELSAGPHPFFARSFTQGIGSTKANRSVTLAQNRPEAQDPIVTLTKTGPATVKKGTYINYTISYRNAGPAASQNARIVDTLPKEVTFVSASNGGTYSRPTHKVTYNLGTVPAGATGSVTLRVIILPSAPVPNGTAIVNRADFTGDLTVSPPTAVWTSVVAP